MIQSAFGFSVFIFIAWLFSENRNRVSWKLIGIGILLQMLLGALFFRIPLFRDLMSSLNGLVLALQRATSAGTSMVFGYLGGGPIPFDTSNPASTFILAFNALPVILVISALSSLFFYWKILPALIRVFSWLLEKSLRIGGAEGLGLSANIFMGMVESPLLIRPYIQRMTRSELFSVLSCGMATVAGTVIVLYAGILNPVVPDALGHILLASVMSVPAAYVISKIMIPESQPLTAATLEPDQEITSAFQAITEGTLSGIRLLVNVVALLVVMVALVELVNIILSLLPDMSGQPLTLQRLFGYVFAPLAWLIGIPWSEAVTAGTLLGTKTIVNELIAYLSMSNLPEESLSESAKTVLLYAMCGFANPGSLGIMIGGLTAIVPDRKKEIIDLSVKSIIAGTLATFMTGAVANIFIASA